MYSRSIVFQRYCKNNVFKVCGGIHPPSGLQQSFTMYQIFYILIFWPNFLKKMDQNGQKNQNIQFSQKYRDVDLLWNKLIGSPEKNIGRVFHKEFWHGGNVQRQRTTLDAG